MGIGNTGCGLLKAILDVIYEDGQTNFYDTDTITAKVKAKGYWETRKAQTPGRTVNSYFSQNPDIFKNVGRNRYCLRPKYFRVLPPVTQVKDGDPVEPSRVRQTVLRTVRQTKLIEQLKIIHDNRCQICGLAIQIGDRLYSEGHHIRPLGRKGPDIISNILILCPNHHVLCDYGGMRLDLADLRLDTRYDVAQEYVDWHNTHFFGD